jgi:lysophospholipase L1-like esterase
MVSSTVEYKEPLWFVNFNDNFISSNPGSEINNLFTRIVNRASIGNGPLKVLHIGDSHIQADYFTGETRRLLSLWLSDSTTTRGFTFPYRLIGSNNPDDYDVKWKGKWQRVNGEKSGIAGVSITTHDPDGEFTIKLKSTGFVQNPFNAVKIIFESSVKNSTPFLVERSFLVEQSDKTVTYQLEQPTESVTVRYKKKLANEELTIHGVELINSQSKVLYHAAGVNGASVKTFQQSNGFASQISIFNPDVVIISLGTNDVYNPSFNPIEFESDLKNLIQRVKEASSGSIILLSTPGDHLIAKKRSNPNLSIVNAQIFSVAKEMGCGVWDFYSIMGGAGSVKLWAEQGLCSPDLLHLSKKGYKLQGALLFDALLRLTGSNPMIENSKFLSMHE